MAKTEAKKGKRTPSETLALHGEGMGPAVTEARLRAMVEAFDGFIYVCSRDYRIEYMNERLAAGSSRERPARGRVSRICFHYPGNMETTDAVEALAAMAQETRLTALRLVVQAGPEGLAAGEIARRLGVPAPTLSFHLRALLHAGLVSSEREGRSLVYAAAYPRLEALVAFLSQSCCKAPARRRT